MRKGKANPKEKVFPYTMYRERYYPIIPVVIEGRERTVIYALVDSGATVSLFHTGVAEDAGIDLDDAEQVYLAGVGGYVRAYIKKRVRIMVEGLGSITIPVAFTEYIASDIALLGRQGFFEAYEITFREWERKLVIRPRNT
ncbi:aspartyl protease family protein [Aeropyrum camini]|uniref:Fructose/tagatose bisphosphate aldolase n=1 Tax=Aeropyrum camini SY1 = JCM 12091 TaxID=1198449 RepID=U3TCC9_9CREN|nr:aspartyl protease family protein [Aeropyrum camini]BAN89680.1 fructose/tagatose bisphosphate aldolase [Aeropyrum camini SY1 = JCM 12091]